MANKKNYKEYVLELYEKNQRPDGRELLQYREPIIIETGVSKNAEGSAIVTMGKTKVICGVKLEIGEPYPDSPDEGTLIVTGEFTAMSSPEFEPGRPCENAVELARIVDRGIRESGAIDVKKLCVKEGEKVWMVFVDVYIQNHDGNLIDASALAAIAALMDAKFPKLEDDGKINYEEHTESLPITKKPITCTIFKTKDKLLIDPTFEEEDVSDARLTVITDEDGVVNGMQKGGTMGMTKDEIYKCIEISLEKAKELRKHL